MGSENFVSIFKSFENRLNAVFQRNTKLLEGGNVQISKGKGPFRYGKKLISKDDVTIEISVFYDKIGDDYLYYNYNIFFDSSKLMFHYEPSHKEHFQPHINVYVGGKELQNAGGEGIHIISHKYHPLEILAVIERYFV
jgi:hypothetical protein